MTNEQLTHYLQDDTYLHNITYEELKTLVMQYPYATNLRILLLKKSFLEQNKDYDRNVKMAATFTTNRKYLYHVIKQIKQFQVASQNVILGEDYLELTELSNIERILAQKNVAEAYGTTNQFETLAADWHVEFESLESESRAIDAQKTLEQPTFNFDYNTQSIENTPITHDDNIEFMIDNIVAEFDMPPIVPQTELPKTNIHLSNKDIKTDTPKPQHVLELNDILNIPKSEDKSTNDKIWSNIFLEKPIPETTTPADIIKELLEEPTLTVEDKIISIDNLIIVDEEELHILKNGHIDLSNDTSNSEKHTEPSFTFLDNFIAKLEDTTRETLEKPVNNAENDVKMLENVGITEGVSVEDEKENNTEILEKPLDTEDDNALIFDFEEPLISPVSVNDISLSSDTTTFDDEELKILKDAQEHLLLSLSEDDKPLAIDVNAPVKIENDTLSLENEGETEKKLIFFEKNKSEAPPQYVAENDVKNAAETVEKPSLELEILNENKVIIARKNTSTDLTSASLTAVSFTEWLKQFRMNVLEKPHEIAHHIKESKPIQNVDNQDIIEKDTQRQEIRNSLDALFQVNDELPDNFFGLVKEPQTNDENINVIEEIPTEEDAYFAENSDKKPKKKKKQMHELAVKSIVADDELVSETLADLLVWQGNRPRAIEMYEKLCLVFPDKSSYFASKIEKLR